MPAVPTVPGVGKCNGTFTQGNTWKQKCWRLSGPDFMGTARGLRQGRVSILQGCRAGHLVRFGAGLLGRFFPGGRLGVGFAFQAQDFLHGFPHHLGDQARIHETHDCRRETQGLIGDKTIRARGVERRGHLAAQEPPASPSRAPSPTLHSRPPPFLSFPETGIVEMVGVADTDDLI